MKPLYKHKTRISSSKIHPLYGAFTAMHQRCMPNYKYAHRYYDRGIRVADVWAKCKWDDFADWAYRNDWEEGLELDRINNNLGYSPNNCRFVTHKENSRNRDIEHHRAATSKGRRSNGRKVVCVETGEIFTSMVEAAEAKGGKLSSSIWTAATRGHRTLGYHWEFLTKGRSK